jgi:plasmid stability protein
MATITIRNVPKDTHDELVSRAAASGKSLQEYVRAELVAMASRPDIATWAERVRERKRNSSSSLSPELILEYLRDDEE